MSGTVRRGVEAGDPGLDPRGLVLARSHAQSGFTGTVRDTSGAVLPGVTVEVASPVLIEGSKTDVTGAEGTCPHRRI